MSPAEQKLAIAQRNACRALKQRAVKRYRQSSEPPLAAAKPHTAVRNHRRPATAPKRPRGRRTRRKVVAAARSGPSDLPGEPPEVHAELTRRAGSWRVRCPWCGDDHYHGAIPGHRVADCGADLGYFLIAPKAGT